MSDNETPAPGPSDVDGLEPFVADVDVAAIEREEHAASYKLAAIEAGRRKAGVAGAAMAGVMLTLHEIYEAPIEDVDIEVVVDSSSDPTDIDTDGIDVTVGDVNVWAPPPGGRNGAGTDG